MKSYNDYLETLKKMVQFRNLFQELNGKKISEITEDVIQHIQNSCVCDYYDKHDQIGDFYFVDADEVFELFEALDRKSVV